MKINATKRLQAAAKISVKAGVNPDQARVLRDVKVGHESVDLTNASFSAPTSKDGVDAEMVVQGTVSLDAPALRRIASSLERAGEEAEDCLLAFGVEQGKLVIAVMDSSAY